MTDKQWRTTEKNGLSVLTGRGEGSGEFMDSPTFAMSRMPFAERMWIMTFMEAVIAIENQAVEDFDPDFLMAVNEYLMRRSDLSVRMLNYWLSGKNFRSMQQVTDYLNERYRVTAEYIRDNELACRRAFKSAGQVFSDAFEEAVSVRAGIPEEVRPYDERLGTASFRQSPVAFLLSVREEERLHYIALLSEVIYEHRKAFSGSAPAPGDARSFVRVFGNLLNTYIKYPEDPEIQALLLSVHMPMDKEDFKDDEKRRAFFNDRLRMASYRWFVNRRGCCRAVIDRWEEYGEYFRHLPEDPGERPVPLLYLDEAVLNIPQFQNDPRKFLRYQLTVEQCCHFLTMLSACANPPENAALGALLVSRYIHSVSEEDAQAADAFFDWGDLTEEDRFYNIEQWIWDLVSIWRYNYKNCRKNVKSRWDEYEEAYRHAVDASDVPDDAEEFRSILEREEFLQDPISILRDMEEGSRLRFIDFCGGLHGLTSEEAATNAMAMSVWLDNTANMDVLRLLNRVNGWKVTDSADTAEMIREFFAKATVSWKYNYGGYRALVLGDLESYDEALRTRLRLSREAEYKEEFRNFREIMEDPQYRENPALFLMQMTQMQCVRFLVFAAALTGVGGDKAVQFASLIKDVLFYPNPGNRESFDEMTEQYCGSDEERRALVSALLGESSRVLQEDGDAVQSVKDNWDYYAEAFQNYKEREKSLRWDLTEKNVRRLFRSCSAAGTEDSGDTVKVSILEEEDIPEAAGVKEAVLRKERLYSARTGGILRSMLGQLEILCHAREHEGHTAFYAEGLKVRRIPPTGTPGRDNETEIWTESNAVLYMLLYLAVGSELFAPLKMIGDPAGEGVETVILLDQAGAPRIEIPTRS